MTIVGQPCDLRYVRYTSQLRSTRDGREFEVNNFYLSDVGAWTYELYEVPGPPGRNDFIEIRIPDLTPDSTYTTAPGARRATPSPRRARTSTRGGPEAHHTCRGAWRSSTRSGLNIGDADHRKGCPAIAR